MKVAKLVAPRKIELFEEEMPAITTDPEMVLVKIDMVGLCGSDYHYFRHGGLGSHKVPLPFVMGHEAIGTVAHSKCGTFNEGDKVLIDPHMRCGECWYCTRGKANLCNGPFLGSINMPGALQEYIYIHKQQLTLFPPCLPGAVGVMLEPLGVALHAAALIKEYRPDDWVVIMGGGPIGRLISLVIPTPSTILDIIPYRGGRPPALQNSADIVFDAAGTQKSIDQCIYAARPGGTIVLIGIPEQDSVTYNPHQARIKELTILNSRRSIYPMRFCAQYCRRYDLEHYLLSMVSHVKPFGEIQEAFEITSGYKDRVMKMVVRL